MSSVHFLRTPSTNFDDLQGFPYRSQFIEIDGMQMHFIDEGPQDAPVMLLMHGMPTWSYLYRHMIPLLVEAGYRCIAPDHMGFGRSDKPTEPSWYNIARHSQNMTTLIQHLNLHNITIVVQDWGGPIGLAQVATMPERFSRVAILNTWLHHGDYDYSPGIQNWINANLPGGIFRDNVPAKLNWGTLMAMSTGRIAPQDSLFVELNGGTPSYSPEAAAVKYGYDAPFIGLGDEGVTGPRRFPLSIPFHDPVSGSAVEQEKHFAAINATTLPVHFIWGTADNIFTTEWGMKWHSLIPGSTFDAIEGAQHFLQDTHGPEIVRLLLGHITRNA